MVCLVRIVRLRSYGLPGGMPPPDFAAMLRKDPLMVEAKALGVQTRKEVVTVDGTKHRTWRSITDVAAECRIGWERRHRTQEAPAAAEDRNADHAAASSSFEPRSRAGGHRAFSRASNDSDPQPKASRGIASLTKEELRRECQRAGIATKMQGFSKKGHKCQVHVPMDELVHKLAVQRKSSLDRLFTRNAGPT